MGAPKGNKNSLGKKNSTGRPTAKYEEEVAQMVRDIFAGKIKKDVIKRVIDAVKKDSAITLKSGWEITMWQLWRGKEKTLISLLNKIVPDKFDDEGMKEAFSNFIRVPLKHDTDDNGYSEANTEDPADDNMATASGETD